MADQEESPPVHAVHYLGRLQSSGSIFLDTKTESQSQQPVRVVAGRHTSPRESGLFKAVATMRAGERAAIYVQVLLVVQTDVSERSAVEERLMALTAAQMMMLEAMFPRHIMEQIASHGATSNLTEKASGGNGWQNVATMDLSKLATHHECVTIMFTDIVGFTAFSKECTPGQVMSFLNELFSKMDGLLDKHNVYKVETAGDCYIICGGLLDEDEDGFKTVASGSPTRVAKIKAARRALNFAVEMMKVASTVMMPNTGKPVVLRAGLHSGPVVSGLVGSRLPKFSLL
ncbi:guanylate cyclase domain-containing protein [Haematococcus lacustris]|uniref:peptidylprolyl isomerase n=1 Tax=Haematococcus lacustris TaxID=44745 RepID=A0A699ZG68_HAELA|nr:guanylate cyclase domain-containing protein [Haematococcus lacustris]